MIYQVRSFNPMCTSKCYCKSMDELRIRVAEIISETNLMRLCLEEEDSRIYKWDSPLNRREIDAGLEIVTIDEKALPEWAQCLGSPSPITDPVVRIENGVKIYARRRSIAN